MTDEQIIDQLKIPAGLSDQAFAQRVVALYEQWMMAGATPDFVSSENKSKSDPDNATPVAERWTRIYATALFGDGYATNVSIANHVQYIQSVEEQSLVAYAETYDPNHYNKANKEPWNSTLTLDKVVSATPNGAGRTIVYQTTESNNGLFNKIGSNQYMNYHLTWTESTSVQGGNEYIYTLVNDK